MNKVILISGSAGSISALMEFLPVLNAEADAYWVMVLHQRLSDNSKLVEIFSNNCSLEVLKASHQHKMKLNTLYVAPADYHLLINNLGEFELDYSEKIFFSRPSIDVSAVTFAEKYGKDLIFVLLSGSNSDGSKGAKRVLEKGGQVIIQDPLDAEMPKMPLSAVQMNTTITELYKAQDLGQIINEKLKI